MEKKLDRLIPLQIIDEPESFNHEVRTPGNVFLQSLPRPNSEEWKGKEYWQKSLPSMRRGYREICAYCACWISHSTGCHTIDHFIPKSIDPILAYEWSNFRYVSARFNSRKGIKSIVDPMSMNFYWFIINFRTFHILPNLSILNEDQYVLATETIKILQLNDDDDLVTERVAYFDDFNKGHIDLHYLKEKAPFLAYEIIRQNLLPHNPRN